MYQYIRITIKSKSLRFRPGQISAVAARPSDSLNTFVDCNVFTM